MYFDGRFWVRHRVVLCLKECVESRWGVLPYLYRSSVSYLSFLLCIIFLLLPVFNGLRRQAVNIARGRANGYGSANSRGNCPMCARARKKERKKKKKGRNSSRNGQCPRKSVSSGPDTTFCPSKTRTDVASLQCVVAATRKKRGDRAAKI